MDATRSFEYRFWSKVNKTDTCWLWIAGSNHLGYGLFHLNGKHCVATRVAWELLRGPIPDGYVLDHDNPEYGCGNPACIRPDHLEPVTRAVNTQRRRNIRSDNPSPVLKVCLGDRRGRSGWCRSNATAVTVI